VNVTSDLAIGLRVALEDAEKIKLNIGDLMRGGGRSGVDEATARRREVLGQKVEEEKDKSKKKDVVDVSSLEVEGVKTISNKLFDEIIEARLGEIFSLVIEQVEQSRNEAVLPAGVVITGGSALLPKITKVAKNIFGVPARVGTPKGVEGLIDEISTPAYSACQGLLLYGALDEGGSRTKNIGSGGSKDKGGNVLTGIGNLIKNLLP
jgi:cell division protein FtsA